MTDRRENGETWREWAISWAKVWALFFGLWLIAGIGAVLWLCGFIPPEDKTDARNAP